MYILIGALLLIVCVLLILIVMVQNPKGGGLSSSFGGSNQIMGVQKTTDFLEKATWVLAIALVVLSLGSQFTGGVESNTPPIGDELLDDAANTVEGFDSELLNEDVSPTPTETETKPEEQQ